MEVKSSDLIIAHSKGKEFKNYLFNLAKFLRLIQKEFHSSSHISISKTLWAWKRGFLRDSVLLYGLNDNNVKDYLSDFNRYLRSPRINMSFDAVLDNKLVFYKLLQDYQSLLPKIYCFLKQEVVYKVSSDIDLNKYEDMLALIKEKNIVVVKPIDGGGGENIYFVSFKDNHYYVNNLSVPTSQLESFFRKLNGYIVVEHIQQHLYASNIFPFSTNTIRILTMWDYSINEPFIAIAVHRFGRESTIPVDNFTQGGLCSLIDLETGKLSKASSFPKGLRLEWHSKHPNSKVDIEGIVIPNWENVKTTILKLSRDLNFIPYIGWDVVICSDEEMKVIEGNNCSSVDLLQVHFPLLKDLSVREFYKNHRVI